MGNEKKLDRQNVRKHEATDQIMLKDEISLWWITKIAIRAAAALHTGNLLMAGRLIWQLKTDIKSGKCYEKQMLSVELTSTATLGMRAYIRCYWNEIKDLLLSLLM